MAAARSVTGEIHALAFTPEKGKVILASFGADGSRAWSKDIVTGLSWTPQAELKIFEFGDRVTIVWRGFRGGGTSIHRAVVGLTGEVVDRASDIGPMPCSTSRGLYWLQGGAMWAEELRDSGAAEIGSVPADRQGLVVCAAQRGYLLGEGELDLLVLPPSVPVAQTMMTETEFGKVEERDHEYFTAGDDLGVLRIGSDGSVAVRELHGVELLPWRTVHANLHVEEGVVDVEADRSHAAFALSREMPETCGDAGHTQRPATMLRAVRWSRVADGDESFELARPVCGNELGPVWLGSTGERLVAAWGERKKSHFTGFVHRTLERESATVRVALPAEALESAGCDAQGCVMVAIERTPGASSKGGQLRIVRYP